MTDFSGLWLAAGLYLLFEIWRGWRRGVVRHGVSVFALLTAGGIGWIFAWMTGGIADRVIPFPVPVGRVIFGLSAGLAFYVAAVVLSSLLFKKTSQQSSGVVRLVYGAGGAFFGLIFGLLILWGGISIFRAVGAIAEAKPGLVPADASLVNIKGTLESGATGSLVERVDIIPSDLYGVITKLIRVSQTPEAAWRFIEYPGTQQLLMDPRMAALFADESLVRALTEGNYLAVLSHPKLAEAVADPGLRKAFSGFDFEKALDYALQSPPTSPAP